MTRVLRIKKPAECNCRSYIQQKDGGEYISCLFRKGREFLGPVRCPNDDRFPEDCPIPIEPAVRDRLRAIARVIRIGRREAIVSGTEAK